MGFGFYGFDSFMFTLVPLIVMVGFVVVIGVIIISFIQGAKEWNKNNNSPVLNVKAKVVTKRTDVRHHTHHHGTDNAAHHSSSSTTYYTTFEVESGDRMELHVPDSEYGLLVEGDMGELTFKGTRYKGFERTR